MNQAIAIKTRSIGCDEAQTVDARELHSFLGVGRDFTTWLTERIRDYGFSPDRDYAIFTKSGENSRRGRKRIEYHLTLDMAKELAMVERNDRGREIRRYFIEAERRYRAQSSASWIEARSQGKVIREVTTSIIATFVEYAKSQGSQSADMYYMNFSKMVNSSLLEIDGKKPVNLRDQLNVAQLMQIGVAEGIITKSIAECLGKRLPYKEIYQIAKRNISVYAATVGRSRLGATEKQTLGLIGGAA